MSGRRVQIRVADVKTWRKFFHKDGRCAAYVIAHGCKQVVWGPDGDFFDERAHDVHGPRQARDWLVANGFTIMENDNG